LLFILKTESIPNLQLFWCRFYIPPAASEMCCCWSTKPHDEHDVCIINQQANAAVLLQRCENTELHLTPACCARYREQLHTARRDASAQDHNEQMPGLKKLILASAHQKKAFFSIFSFLDNFFAHSFFLHARVWVRPKNTCVHALCARGEKLLMSFLIN